MVVKSLYTAALDVEEEVETVGERPVSDRARVGPLRIP